MSEDSPQWAAPGRPGEPEPPSLDSGAPPPPSPVPPQWDPATPVTTPALYAEFRPGIVPLRPLLMSDIFGGVTAAIRGNPAATLGLGLVTTLIFAVPAAFAGGWLVSWATSRFAGDFPSELTDSGTSPGRLFGQIGSILPSLATSGAVLLMTAFMAHVIGQGVIGRKTSLGQTWAATRGRLLAVVCSAVLLFLLIGAVSAFCIGGPILLLVAGSNGSNGTAAGGFIGLVLGVLVWLALVILLSIRFSFASSSIVLEQLGPVAGLRRSWRLTSGQQFWRILGIRLLVGLMTAIAGQILALPISYVLNLGLEAVTSVESTIAVGTVFIAAVSAVITGTLTTPFSAGASTLLYIDQRIRREALDVQLVRAAQSGA